MGEIIWNSGAFMLKGSTAIVISLVCPAMTSAAVIANVCNPISPTANLPNVGRRIRSSAMGRANNGKTVIMVRPGNHQPIMVTARSVAINNWAAMRANTSRDTEPPCRSNPVAGKAINKTGAQWPIYPCPRTR